MGDRGVGDKISGGLMKDRSKGSESMASQEGGHGEDAEGGGCGGV